MGDMLALGSDTARYHAELAPRIERARIGLLVTVGELANLANPGSVETVHFADGGLAAAAVADLMRPGDLVAVKASSGMRLVRVVEAIRGIGVAAPAGNWRVEDDEEPAALRAAI
jgi:UDP-N-acetylmuramyl pentapeptide synthase